MTDVPTEGLAPTMVDLARGLLENATCRGMAILPIGQQPGIALAISRRLHVMGHGRIVPGGAPQDPRATDALRGECSEV